MSAFLSALVVLAALVALASPLWLKFVIQPDSEEEYVDRLDKVTNFILEETDLTILEELGILVGCRRLLLHIDLLEGRARLVKGYG